MLVFSSGNELECIQENLVAPAEKMSTDMDAAAGSIIFIHHWVKNPKKR